jgi:hypothetical protein
MTEATTDVQRDIALTRERMSKTIAELDARISSRVTVITEKLDLAQLVQSHPWPVLVAALGLGVLLAGTAADRRAARATLRGARRGQDAAVNLARRGWSAAGRVVRRDGRGDGAAAHADAVASEPGLADRVKDAVARAVGVDELVTQMRDAADQLARPASYVGQNVPRNTGQQL